MNKKTIGPVELVKLMGGDLYLLPSHIVDQFWYDYGSEFIGNFNKKYGRYKFHIGVGERSAQLYSEI